MNEDELCDIILDNINVMTCIDCGESLESQISGADNDTRIGVLHIYPTESDRAQYPDVPPSVFFECVKCCDETTNACEPAAEFRQKSEDS